MGLDFRIEPKDAYAVVRVEGEPSLGQFQSFIQLIAVESAGWSAKRVMFDLRGVRSLTSFTEHYAVGEEAARQLRHLHRIASVVPADRLTRASEKTAQASGLNLRVFTDEASAVAWLLA